MARKHEVGTPGNREALLRALCEHPDETGPRLQYAECLQSTGDANDALRAEFIRVQCELSQIDFSDNRWEQLYSRQEKLGQYCDRWAGELPKLDGVYWNQFEFRRGFVWDVTCDNAQTFREHATVIFASAPIQSLGFRKLKSITPVLAVSEISRIKRLIAEDFRLGLTDARSLANSRHMSNLAALHLSGNRFADKGVAALAASRQLLQLDNLDLGYNQIGNEGVAALAASPVVASLTHLGLAGNPLTNVGALALVSSPHLNQLTGMTLWDCQKIGPKGREALKAKFGDTVSFED